jgi:ABC-type polysaccharide/polyol phosphate export permease
MQAILLIVMIVTGHRLPPSLVWLPLVYLLQGLMTYGLGIFLATATAYFRDMMQFVSIALQVWFWMTPIVYFRELTERIVSFGPMLLLANPLYYLSRAFQILFYENVVYYDFLPQKLLPSQSSFFPTLGVLLLCGIVFTVLGNLFYLKLKKELPDQI